MIVNLLSSELSFIYSDREVGSELPIDARMQESNAREGHDSRSPSEGYLWTHALAQTLKVYFLGVIKVDFLRASSKSFVQNH